MSHSHPSQKHGKAFALGIVLNTLYVGVEFFYGLQAKSTALVADAGHNLSDVLSLALAWAAILVAAKRPSGRYTYGLRKTTIMASLVNGILIVGAAVLIARDAVLKFQEPAKLQGDVVMMVAALGLLVNTGTAYLFYKDRQKDLNIQGAFLHMAADAGVTLGVLLGGLAIKFTGQTWIDPVLGLLIVLVILYGTWQLLSDSVALALDAVPKGIDLEEVREFLAGVDGVEDVHDLHVWAISTTETALTSHLIIPDGYDDQLLYDIRESLHQKFDIGHTTLQVEKDWKDSQYRPLKRDSVPSGE